MTALGLGRAERLWILAALSLASPWMVLHPHAETLEVLTVVALSGLSIVGAAFILSWASELAQMEISPALATILLALVAVLPEYAVDLYYAWDAGKVLALAPPGTHPLELGLPMANMTGANRLLIGLGWPLVVLAAWWRTRERRLELEQDAGGLDMTYLAVATLYSFVIPFKASLGLIDAFVFVTLFVMYARQASRGAVHEPHLEGVPLAFSKLPRRPRRLATIGMFLFAGLAIFLAAEPFAEGLKDLGTEHGLDPFLVVQWLAPLASESPEFIVAVLFALRGVGRMGLAALVSSKVNQWTLLVGMIPLAVCAASRGHLALPLDARQQQELLLTAAQSAFAVALTADLRLSLGEAAALAGLFVAQLMLPSAHGLFIVVYLALAVVLLALRRDATRRLAGNVRLYLRW